MICAEHLPTDARIAEFDLPVRDSARPDYLGGVNDWHDAIADAWAVQIASHLPDGGRVALLVWGDPSLYDSSLRIADRLRAGGQDLRIEVVPGLTSLQLLTAVHAIALNTLGSPVMITTGRQLRDRGWPDGVDTVVVMLDSGGAFEALPPEGLHIYWAAFLGMPMQIALSGPLHQVGPEILRLRAKARADHGWIMDTYLLRREGGSAR